MNALNAAQRMQMIEKFETLTMSEYQALVSENEQLRQRVAELEQQLTEVRRAEREKCAKVVEEGTALTAFQSKDCYSYAYNRAAAIRSME